MKNRGIGVVGILTTVFIVLKLANLISWPWVWVLCPIWIDFAIYFIIIGFIYMYGIIRDYKDKLK